MFLRARPPVAGSSSSRPWLSTDGSTPADSHQGLGGGYGYPWGNSRAGKGLALPGKAPGPAGPLRADLPD